MERGGAILGRRLLRPSMCHGNAHHIKAHLATKKPWSSSSGSLSPMLSTLLTASDEQAAYVCGILWEATSDLAVAQQ
eukprot:scaffold108004_cov17-Tisochrysis_lutea.AAC.1